MIEEARDLSTLQAAPHALIFPGIAIALTVLAFNFIGDGLREHLDLDNVRDEPCLTRDLHSQPV